MMESVIAGLILQAILTLPFAFFSCRDLFCRKKMWMKVTTNGIAISRVFGKLIFVPWDKIEEFEDRSNTYIFLFGLKDHSLYLNLVKGCESIDGQTDWDSKDTLQLAYFWGAGRTAEKLNGYLRKFKAVS